MKFRLKAFCDSQYEKWKLMKIYSDSSTGTNMNSTGLIELIHDARNGKKDMILVFRVDR